MSFRYRAASADGRIAEGMIAAESPAGAMAELRQRGLVPVALHAVDESPTSARSWPWRSHGSSSEAVALVCRTVGTLTTAGVSIDRALAFAGSQVTHPEVQAAVQAVAADVRAGSTMADALRRHGSIFPQVMVALIDAGAQTGALDEALLRAAAWLDERQAWRAQVRTALLYPALIAVVTVVATIVLLTAVVPRFVAILQDAGATLPMTTRLLLAVSGFLGATWWGWVLVTAFGTIGVRQWLRDPEARIAWDRWRLRLPVVGALDNAIGTARYTRTLGQLLQGGMPLLGAMQLAGTAVPNRAMAQALEGAQGRVRDGLRVAAALESILPPLAQQLLAAGEESGQLPTLCLRIADSSEESVRRSLRTLAALVEPVVIILFGAIVGFVALAMLQAMYGLQATSWGAGLP